MVDWGQKRSRQQKSSGEADKKPKQPIAEWPEPDACYRHEQTYPSGSDWNVLVLGIRGDCAWGADQLANWQCWLAVGILTCAMLGHRNVADSARHFRSDLSNRESARVN